MFKASSLMFFLPIWKNHRSMVSISSHFMSMVAFKPHLSINAEDAVAEWCQSVSSVDGHGA